MALELSAGMSRATFSGDMREKSRFAWPTGFLNISQYLFRPLDIRTEIDMAELASLGRRHLIIAPFENAVSENDDRISNDSD